MNCILLIIALLFLPTTVFADVSTGVGAAVPLDLSHHFVGYLSVFLTVAAYVAAMSEDMIDLRKSKPMVLGAALIWFTICIYYALHGEAKVAALAFESNLLA